MFSLKPDFKIISMQPPCHQGEFLLLVYHCSGAYRLLIFNFASNAFSLDFQVIMELNATKVLLASGSYSPLCNFEYFLLLYLLEGNNVLLFLTSY